MAHYSHDFRPRRSAPSRFFDPEFEKQAARELAAVQKEMEEARLDASFARQHQYFENDDIRKFRYMERDDPDAFRALLNADPEVKIENRLFEDREIKRKSVINLGLDYIDKICEPFKAENFEKDDKNVFHLKTEKLTDIEKDQITQFNSAFIEECEVFSEKKAQLEDQLVNNTQVIRNEREQKKQAMDRIVIENQVQMSKRFERKIRKIEKKLDDPKDDPTVTASISKLDRYRLKKEINDESIKIQNQKFDKPKRKVKYTQEWFDEHQHDIFDYAVKFNVDKYEKGKFVYRHKHQHMFAFICSAGGKTTLAAMYGKYVTDFDRMLDYEKDMDKFEFLMGYSRYYKNWKIGNNYWKEMFLTYEYKFRNKVILAHSPDQIPDGAITDIGQGLIILPSVKKWNLRAFNDNYTHLQEYAARGNEKDWLFQKFELHYRYYFFVIFNYLGLHNLEFIKYRY